MSLARACLSGALRGRCFPSTIVAAARLKQGLAPASPLPLPYSSSAIENRDDDKSSVQVEVTQTSSLAPARGRGRRWLSWRNPRDHFPLHMNSGLGNALMQVSENLNRLLKSWSPSRLLGRLKEDDKCYKLRFMVPGLRKEDVRVTVEDGMLVITGEVEEEEEDHEGGRWYAYGYYNTTLLLPEDAKVDEITAELRDGVLRVYIPRVEEKKSYARIELHFAADPVLETGKMAAKTMWKALLSDSTKLVDEEMDTHGEVELESHGLLSIDPFKDLIDEEEMSRAFGIDAATNTEELPPTRPSLLLIAIPFESTTSAKALIHHQCHKRRRSTTLVESATSLPQASTEASTA
ncbi:26.5 kDa heat shock protein, mitochondrial-like [Zingiber officinale]|uniref:26.5 kDa heat shock protein, mitochondrial-like n=1 Tax=Zingiber officinale TaxID=94328 RepID=UPI001C4BF6CA|nr:26.5 kDa heat shock protein, mitochondrial-like [Zingiber officinale]